MTIALDLYPYDYTLRPIHLCIYSYDYIAVLIRSPALVFRLKCESKVDLCNTEASKKRMKNRGISNGSLCRNPEDGSGSGGIRTGTYTVN